MCILLLHVTPLLLHTLRMLQAYYNGNQAPLRSALSPADSRLNSTFTKDSAHTPSVEKAPVTSYQMTPADSDPLIRCNNYDIADLSASDSTDDDEDPKKVLIYTCSVLPDCCVLWLLECNNLYCLYTCL